MSVHQLFEGFLDARPCLRALHGADRKPDVYRDAAGREPVRCGPRVFDAAETAGSDEAGFSIGQRLTFRSYVVFSKYLYGGCFSRHQLRDVVVVE